MAKRITPTLGPDLDQVWPATGAYWDNQLANTSISGVTLQPSYELGTVVRGDDGGEYYYVKASAAITGTATTGTAVNITFPAYTIAAGGSTFYTPPDTPVAEGGFVHVRRGAFNATPA